MKQLTQKNKRRLDNVKHEVLPSLAGNRQPKRVKYHPDSRGYGHLKDTSAEFCIEPSNRPDDKESDPMRLQQRQKQVDYGKNTLGYERYLSSVPKEKRVRGVHFWTPNIHRKCSKRAFAGQVGTWWNGSSLSVLSSRCCIILCDDDRFECGGGSCINGIHQKRMETTTQNAPCKICRRSWRTAKTLK